MIVVIHDANVLIDLQSAELLDEFFQLALDNHTSDFVLDEVEKPLTPYIRRKRLKVRSWTANEVADIAILLATQPKRISIQDCSALKLAQELGGVLLTGDGNLRVCAQSRGIEVRGTLWIFDLLVDSGSLTKSKAAKLLQKLVGMGRRFPPEACEERMKKWA